MCIASCGAGQPHRTRCCAQQISPAGYNTVCTFFSSTHQALHILLQLLQLLLPAGNVCMHVQAGTWVRWLESAGKNSRRADYRAAGSAKAAPAAQAAQTNQMNKPARSSKLAYVKMSSNGCMICKGSGGGKQVAGT